MSESYTNIKRRRIKNPNKKSKLRWLLILPLVLIFVMTAYTVLQSLSSRKAADQVTTGEATENELPDLTNKEQFKQAYLEANGGMDHLQNLKTLRLDGTIHSRGNEIEIFILKRRPDMVLMSYKLENQEVTYGHADGKFWVRQSQAQAPDTTQEMSEEAKALMKSDILMFDPILSIYVDSVGEVQNIESAEYDGDDALEVTVELKHFEEAVRLVVNPSTMRIRSQYAKRPDGRTEHLEFGDYRSIEGVNIPHSFDAKVDGEPEGQFVLHKASFNIGVSSSLFHPKSLRD